MLRRLVAGHNDMLIKFSVKNPIFVNLLMVVILLVGFMTYTSMPRELIPQFTTNAIQITTVYAGAAPEEIDKLLTAKIEDAIAELDGIDYIVGASQESISRITVTTDAMISDNELYVLLDDIRNQIDIVKSELPENAEDPQVAIVKPNINVVNVAIYGDVPELVLKEYAEKLQDELEALTGVNRVTLAGIRDREIWIEISPELLDKFGLTVEQVRSVISRSQIDLAAGTIKSHVGEYLVRTRGETDRADMLKNLVVHADATGAQVRLSDIAKVTDTFADAFTIGRFNGKPSCLLLLSKEATGDTINIAEAVTKKLEEFSKTLPAAIEVGTFADTSVFVRERLVTLLKQGAQALVLVLATLCLFLSLRMAFFTALGIPISFLGGVIIVSMLGYTMNMITMFAFIMVLGLVVDDAIVVTENCFRLMERGVKAKAAAVLGAQQMLWPVTAAIATTIAAFLPLMMMPGRMGKFMGAIPITISVVLLFSLFECLLILPSHIADWSPRDAHLKIEQKRNKRFDFFGRFLGVYERVLKICMAWRYVFVFSMFMLFVVAVSYAVYKMPLSFSKEFEGDQFMVNIECPTTYRLEDTVEAAKKVEKIILGLPKHELIGFSTTVGIFADNPYEYRFASNISQFYIDLVSLDERRTTTEIMDEVRSAINKLPEIVNYNLFALRSNPGGKAVEVFIGGPDLEKLKEISKIARDFVEKQPGARDVQDDFVLGKRELVVELNDSARSLGFDNFTVASQLRSAYTGYEAARIRPQGEDFPIIVRFESSLREERTSVDDLWLVSSAGLRVRLTDIATIIEQPGLQSLKRRDGKRTITVSAEVNENEGNASMIVSGLIEEVQKVIKESYPGYSITPGGQHKELQESLDALMKAAVVAMFLILIILVGLFRSLFKPLIIMVPIPLSMIGVIIGHVVHNSDLVILSLMGAIALAGVVVNDSILLLDFINSSRRKGMSPIDAATNSGRMRMRPVILTTVTTICGLATLAFFATGQTKFLAPMAVSIVWGIAFATVLTLLVVPCLYLIYTDVRRLLGKSDESEFELDSLENDVKEAEDSGVMID